MKKKNWNEVLLIAGLLLIVAIIMALIKEDNGFWLGSIAGIISSTIFVSFISRKEHKKIKEGN